MDVLLLLTPITQVVQKRWIKKLKKLANIPGNIISNFIKTRVMVYVDQVPKTALDIFRQLPEGTLCEVIDNVLYMSPAPLYNHQKLVGHLFGRILQHLEVSPVGEIILSPFEVYLESLQSAVQPDLLVVLKENAGILKKDGHIHGAPDIIIEILSQDRNRDLIKKKKLYEKAGVKEYFVIDPANSKVFAWTLSTDKYIVYYTTTGLFKSALLQLQFTF